MNKKQFIILIVVNILVLCLFGAITFKLYRYEYITKTSDFGQISFTYIYRVDKLTGEITQVENK